MSQEAPLASSWLHSHAWDAALIAVFVVGSARNAIFPILEPWIAGSHAAIYTEAARAALTGADPWAVGPPAAIFAGPPPMLLPFLPFVWLPEPLTRLVWVIGMAAVALWAVRRMGLPLYWLLYPPFSAAIILGHPEALVLALLLLPGPLAGLAAAIKPYAGLPLVAERRWTALVLTAVVVAATAVFLPWGRFLAELPGITDTLARQSGGDSVFGEPVLMAVAVVALLALGWKRALWLATPVLWPAAQPGYKLICTPQISPIIAVFWSFPVPGSTLAGVIAEALVAVAARRWKLHPLILRGAQPIARPIAGVTA